MLKSTAAFLGFLFGLATANYLSYWGFFNINAFQYMAVEDIIKGIAYPLRYGGAWLLGAIGLILFLNIADAITSSLPKRGKWLLGILLVLSVTSTVTYVQYADNTVMGMIFSIVLSLPIMAVYFIIEAEHGRSKAANSSAEHPLLTAFNVLLVYASIFLSINAIVAGQVEARAIHSGRRFTYLLSKDLPKKKVDTKEPYLIFLGAVSEKYIFIDKREDEHFILDKENLPSLRLHYYDEANSASQRHFKRHLKEATAKHKTAPIKPEIASKP